MTLTRWPHSAFRPRLAARQRPPVRRPAVERLEDRTTPSTGGLLDPTFGSGGQVMTSFTNNWDQANAVATQPDGKLVVVGTTTASGSSTGGDFLVARYNADGTPDRSFGSGGYAATDFKHLSDRATAVALQSQPDGTNKVLAAGTVVSTVSHQNVINNDFGLARYTASGALDPTFGTKGKVITDLGGNGDWVRGMAVDGSGRILVAGVSDASGVNTAVLVRYTANGLDTTFGNGGKLVTNIQLINGGDGVALQADGKIVLAGNKIDSATHSYEFCVARFNANGTADTTFGTGGQVATHVGGDDWTGGVTIDSSGRILIAGYDEGDFTNGYYLLRYTPNGALDAGFGSVGVATLANPAGWRIVSGYMVVGVAVQANGQIVVGGNLGDVQQGQEYVTAVRANPDGTLDTGYGDGGWASTVVGTTGEALAMTLQPDGRLVLAGYTHPTTNSRPVDVTLVRFLASAPQVGSLTANPNPAAAGSSVTLTSGGITDGNAGATVSKVTFYYLDATGAQQVLGYGRPNGDGTWSMSFSTADWAAGSYTVYAQATDSDGVIGDPCGLTLQLV
jgi:uncharacterized delta-60 repeat protein